MGRDCHSDCHSAQGLFCVNVAGTVRILLCSRERECPTTKRAELPLRPLDAACVTSTLQCVLSASRITSVWTSHSKVLVVLIQQDMRVTKFHSTRSPSRGAQSPSKAEATRRARAQQHQSHLTARSCHQGARSRRQGHTGGRLRAHCTAAVKQKRETIKGRGKRKQRETKRRQPTKSGATIKGRCKGGEARENRENREDRRGRSTQNREQRTGEDNTEKSE